MHYIDQLTIWLLVSCIRFIAVHFAIPSEIDLYLYLSREIFDSCTFNCLLNCFLIVSDFLVFCL